MAVYNRLEAIPEDVYRRVGKKNGRRPRRSDRLNREAPE